MSKKPAAATKMPWFRLYHSALDNNRLRLLAFEDRWHYIALLCCKRRGMLDADQPGDLTRRMVASALGIQVRELEEVARRLMEVGLIDDVTLQPLGWDEHQFKSDWDSTTAARQARYRARHASESADDPF